MGKKDRKGEEAPNPTSVPNRDILQRLNFLYQASVLLNALAPPDATHHDDDVAGSSTGESDPPSHPARPEQKKRRRRVVSVGELSRSYVEAMRSVGQKTNVRMDPSVKRRICKRCCAPLVPGLSATVRVRDSASHGHLVAYRCHCCQAERRVPAPPAPCVEPSTNEDAVGAQSATGVETPSIPVVTTSTGTCRQQRKKGPKTRPPPHFARDIGHVVFRGNELLDAVRSIP